MPSKSSGRIVKSQKGKKFTPTQKNHRWESFTTKISKLHSLDPLRRVRRHDLDTEDLQLTTSYLRNGMEKWAELNISSSFTSFKREVMPLCDSLPQIVHFQDKIMGLFSKYIAAHETEALEPLLELLTAFAHDLGVQFEKYYSTALSLITGIVSRPQDAAVIEWTFACLAFLFKYLSKLLVQDLRPTYDALLPLLGKAKSPPHIVRFAAEALSFLVKKAAAPANREKALPLFIEHARADFASFRDHKQLELYFHGLMTIFAEAVKGHGQGLHTAGPEIIKALVSSVPNEESITAEPMTWSDIVCGVLVSAVHHTNLDTFQPALLAVTEMADSDQQRIDFPLRNCLYIRFLGAIAGVRKGNRVKDWSSLLSCLLTCVKAVSQNRNAFEALEFSVVWRHTMVNIAIVSQQAPMDSIIPCVTDLVNLLTKDPLMPWFIPFCSYFSEMDGARFRSLFLKPFQRFVVTHWSEESNEDMLCVCLPQMVRSGSLPSLGDSESFSLPQSWQDQIVSKFERLEISPFPESGASSAYNKDSKTWHEKCLPKYSALLRLLETTTVRPSTYGPISDLLLKKLKLALRPSLSLANDEARFIVSEGFSAYLRMCNLSGQVDTSLSPLLRAAAPRYHRLTGFLEALGSYEELIKDKRSPPHSDSGSNGSHENEEDPFLKCLIQDLSAPSHEHRLAALNLLVKLDIAPDQSACLATMLQTEATPLDVQNMRAIAVHIRKLAVTYSSISADSWLLKAIPSYLFGMLTVQLTPIWDSAAEALKDISDNKSGAEVVSDLALQWLGVPSKRWQGHSGDPSSGPSHKGLTDFECLNLMKLQTKAEEVIDLLSNATDNMLESFEDRGRLVPVAPLNARSQALKVLQVAPGLAEKRSRRFIPFFLSWNTDAEDQENSAEDLEAEDSGASLNDSWSLFDKKALLKVLTHFVNPKVLYQSEQVYLALLGLIANGDIDIQKSALKAILAWKQTGVRPYQENLEFLLDESRFKNELTVLFQGENQIQPDHRSEMMPILLRLLYGRTISKKGVASGKGGQHATRLAVLRHLNVQDMGSFLDIALGDLGDLNLVEGEAVRESLFEGEILTVRKQVGFLRMMEAMIQELGEDVSPYAGKILNAVLYCLVLSCRRLGQSTDEMQDDAEPSQTSLYRAVRTTALKCLVSLLQRAKDFEWEMYRNIIIREVVSPRVEKLPVENTQGISSTLQLLSTLSSTSKTAVFLSIDDRLVGKLAECLVQLKTKIDVKVFALRILRNLVVQGQKPAESESAFTEQIKRDLLHDTNVELILASVSAVLKSQGDLDKDLLGGCVEMVIELSPMLQRSGRVVDLIDIAVFLLNQPSRRVNPRIKGSVLAMLENLLQLGQLKLSSELHDRIYSAISTLFAYFRDRPNRQALCRILNMLCQNSPESLEIASLCSQLNSFRENRIDEPDYANRLAAFNVILKPRDISFKICHWEPLIHNMIFYLKHDEEYGVLASNSADCIGKFIDAACVSSAADKDWYETMLSNVVMPAVHANSRESSEIVRRETVRVLGLLVSKLPEWPAVSDLVGLNPEPDERDSDPGFFSNILSPAVTKQMRALQLLSKANYHSQLGSRNIAHFFVPLLEHFIFGREDGSDDRGIGAQAGTSIADLAVSLEWPQYRAILRRYIGYVETKPELQKQLIRLLGKTVDSLTAAVTSTKGDEQGSMDVDDNTGSKDAVQTRNVTKSCRLVSTLPSEEKFNEDFLTNILPPLLDYLHDKDETKVSARVPIGIILVKILKLLPTESLNQKLPGLLTDICHILRSKALDSREMSRDTLAKMSIILGPSCFGFVLTELRGALTKGYQLHVLSYTVHTILVNVIPHFKPGDLDYCLDSIMAVIMDDIFGITGQEKDAEEYTNKMKEIKSSKSHDSMELIARTASISHLGQLVRPLQALLMEKLDLRMVRKIDDLLTRITSGLLNNSAAESRDTLVFCYEVIQKVYDSEKPQVERKVDPRVKRYLIQKGARRSGDRGSTSKYTFKLVRFAMDVLRSVLRKHDSLRHAGNIAGFVPILGDAVIGSNEEVKIATFKLLGVISKVPFKTDDATKIYKVAAKEATRCLSSSTTTTTDLAQTALKLLSVILRDRRDVEVKDTAVDMLLGKVKDDLTEPLYRHVTFNFLRSILERKVETAVVYDTLDYVGTVMITNPDQNTRDLARGAYFQFLREYPQKKNRWTKQLNFIVANLKYEREGGRISALETVHLLLMKSAMDFVQEISSNCFIPLVFVLANDDSEKCRLAAAELIKLIFQKADDERTTQFLTLVRNWSQNFDNSSVVRLGIQALTLYFEAREPTNKDRKELKGLMDSLIHVMTNYSDFADDADLINTILQTMPVLIEKHPATILADRKLWKLVTTPLSHPDDTVKLSGVRVLSTYLADFYGNNQDAVQPPIEGSHGLKLEMDMVEQLAMESVAALNPATVARWRRKAQKVSGSTGRLQEPLNLEKSALNETLAGEVSRVVVMLSKFLDVSSEHDKEMEKNEGENEEEQDDNGEEWDGINEREDNSEDEDGSDSEGSARKTPARVTLQSLTRWLSDILIEETPPKADALIPKVAAMDILTVLGGTLPAASLLPSLGPALTACHHLTDPQIANPHTTDETFRSRSETLKTRATELQDALQRKVGSAAYTAEFLRVTERARRRRESRSRKRKIEAVSQPEKWGKWKRGRLEKKVQRRKDRGAANRERRHQY